MIKLTSQPVWLLDVDGVINAPRPGWSEAPRRADIWAKGAYWRMRWSPSMLHELRSIVRSGTVQVVWATTWCPWADELERMFRLPPLMRAFTSEELDSRSTIELKQELALEVAYAGQRLIWTDDDAIPTSGLERVALEAAGALLIAPHWRRGLQSEHLRLIRDQLSAWDGSVPDLGAP
jgi:hypothetical protein